MELPKRIMSRRASRGDGQMRIMGRIQAAGAAREHLKQHLVVLDVNGILIDRYHAKCDGVWPTCPRSAKLGAFTVYI